MLELPIECLNERFCVQVAICRQPLFDPITENVTRSDPGLRSDFRSPCPKPDYYMWPTLLLKSKACQADLGKMNEGGKREVGALGVVL